MKATPANGKSSRHHVPALLRRKRSVQIVLGVLWLLDGCLQLQRQMFTNAFANQVIAPSAQGQPVVVSGPIHIAMHVLLMHPAVLNACFALIQLALGAGIIWKRTTKQALLGSVAWGVFVWYLGEGLGGILSGQTTLLMGAPGAALVYAILALAVLPGARDDDTDDRPAAWLTVIWAVIWCGGALYQLLPGQNSVGDLSAMIAGNANGAPGWLASLDMHVARGLQGFGTVTGRAAMAPGIHMTAAQMAQMPLVTQHTSGFWFIVLLAAVQAAIGLAIVLPRRLRTTVVGAGIVVSILFWVVGQSLGDYFSGLATDPSTAPLIIVLGLAVLGGYPEQAVDKVRARFYRSAERVLIGGTVQVKHERQTE